MKITRLDRVAFILASTLLLLLYGYGTRAFGWYPGALIDRALAQAYVHFGPPNYLNDRVFPDYGLRSVMANETAPGLTLISTHMASWEWRTGLMLIDNTGRSLHEWPVDVARLFGDGPSLLDSDNAGNVHGSYLFIDGDLLVTVSYQGIARLDACGEVLWKLRNGAHHSIAPADDGTFWIPMTSPRAVPHSERYPDGYPGLQRQVDHDHLLHISSDGEPLDSISILDILYRNDLTRFLSKVRPHYEEDITHVNDVEPLSATMADEYPLFEAGDLLVSLRSSDLVMVVDPVTERVKWHISDPLVHQHDPDFIGGGWIGVFDNREDGTDRGAMLGGSRIVAFQPHTDSSKVLFRAGADEVFYTPVLGKWQLLKNGNMLLTEGVTGRLLEVAPDGRPVWEWINEPYDEDHSVEVTEGTRYPLTPQQVAAWPCNGVHASETAP